MPRALYDSEMEAILADVKDHAYETAALRFKRMAAHCKSAGMNREQFGIVASVIDDHLKAKSTLEEYHGFRVAIGVTRDAALSANDLRLTLN